jgi:hypothetical protein
MFPELTAAQCEEVARAVVNLAGGNIVSTDPAQAL